MDLTEFLQNEGIERVECGFVQGTVHEDVDNFDFLSIFQAQLHDTLKCIIVILEKMKTD